MIKLKTNSVLKSLLKFKFINKDMFKIKKFNLMKHKLIYIITTITLFLILIGTFIFNICTNKYDFNSMIEKTKTVVTIPINKTADSQTLNQVQNTISKLLNTSCNTQATTNYTNKNSTLSSDFQNYLFNKNGQQELQLTITKSSELTQQQKNLIFSTLTTQFPNLTMLKNANELTVEKFSNLQNNTNYWVQLGIFISILTVILLIYLGFKFKQLKFMLTIFIASTNLILSIGITFLSVTILTNRINLIFLIGVAIYFISNLTTLFNEIKSELASSESKVKIYDTANSAINKLLPQFVFTVLILLTAIISSLVFSLIYSNFLVFYFAISCSIGIIISLLTNTLFNAQLWVILKNIKIKSKKLNKIH